MTRVEVESSLLGLYAVWYDDKGKHGGPIVAVYVSGARLEVAVLSESGKLETRGAHGLIIG